MAEYLKNKLSDFKNNLNREYLLTNRIGGYSCSNIFGIPMRKYHGLLVASTRPPVDRVMLLNKIEETFEINGEQIVIDSNIYPEDIVYPYGYKYLNKFNIGAFAVWEYTFANIVIKKVLGMLPDKNAVYLKYICSDGNIPVRVKFRPLIAIRNHHHIQKYSANLKYYYNFSNNNLTVNKDGFHNINLNVHIENTSFIENPLWYYNLIYTIDKMKGELYKEDLYSPGYFETIITGPIEINIIISDGKCEMIPFSEAEEMIKNRYQEEYNKSDTPKKSVLFTAADSFIVKRDSGWSVIAGYPWFTDWGRDTMISFAGLTLCAGRFDIAKDILLSFKKYLSRGMIPNRFPDWDEEPAYNTADATLWYAIAIYKYYQYTEDFDFIKEELYDELNKILDSHIEGTRFSIKMSEDGMLSSGLDGLQLTWMDAKIEDYVVTPRIGKPVEIQALWYNLLKIIRFFAEKIDDTDTINKCDDIILRLENNFVNLFWYDEGGFLYDNVMGNSKDSSLRPNQLLTLSLPFNLIKGEKAYSIFEKVKEKLLTPFGLRTLAPDDYRYAGIYQGDLKSRDMAYHQGTVWPWLLGPYFTSYFNIYGRNEETKKEVTEYLDYFLKINFNNGCIDNISEIFDGDFPHNPRGCTAQAWSVAEILRIIIEENLDL